MSKGSKRRPMGIQQDEYNLRYALAMGKITYRQFLMEIAKLKGDTMYSVTVKEIRIETVVVYDESEEAAREQVYNMTHEELDEAATTVEFEREVIDVWRD